MFFGSWRLVGKDGRVFVMAGGLANKKALIDETQAAATIASGIGLVLAG